MKKLILLLLAAAVATTAAAQAQRDTLTFNNDYYFSKRNVEELVPVTGQNIVMLGNSLTAVSYTHLTLPTSDLV